MNMSIIYDLGRGTGKTHEIARICKDKGWTMVVATMDEVRRVEKEYGVNAVSITYGTCFRGRPGPYLWDHHASAVYVGMVEHQLDKVKKERDDLKNDVGNLREQNFRVSNKSDTLQKMLDSCALLEPICDIHEDYGDVILWNIKDKSYALGSCIDDKYNEADWTHFQRIMNPTNMEEELTKLG